MPALKRGLCGGEVGKDVQGVQRGVHAALHGVRRGRAQRQERHLWRPDRQRYAGVAAPRGDRADGEHGPADAGHSLAVDGRLRAVACTSRRRSAQAPTLPHGELRYGWDGDRVRALQQMLWRALEDASVNARNATYGDGVRRDLELFAEVADLNPAPDPDTCTQSVWEMCYGFADAYARELAADAAGSSSGVRSELVTHAEWYVATGGQYVQARPYQMDDPPRTPLENDCSGSIHHLFLLAGGPDPSGRGIQRVRATRAPCRVAASVSTSPLHPRSRLAIACSTATRAEGSPRTLG